MNLVQPLHRAGHAADEARLGLGSTWEWEAASASDQLEIRRVGVVGLGTTGLAIAELCLQAGVETIGCELWQDGQGAARFESNPSVARLLLASELTELAACDLVVECLSDRTSAKRELIAELDHTIRAGALIATYTAGASVTELAASTDRPQRVVGLHLPRPTGSSPLVEVIRGELTEAEAFESVVGFLSLIGWQPVRCNDTPGLIVDRVLIPLLNDCVRVLDEADVTPEDLDASLRLGAGWSLGPCALLDLVGIDAHVAAAETLYASLREPRMAPPPRLVRMRRAGLLGRKTGRGFYAYPDGRARPVGGSHELD